MNTSPENKRCCFKPCVDIMFIFCAVALFVIPSCCSDANKMNKETKELRHETESRP